MHADPERRELDRRLRDGLRGRRHEVHEIPASELHDRESMRFHLARIASILLGREAARRIREEDSWFEE